MAGLFDVRGVHQQGEDALPAELAEAREVDHAAGDGGHVDLEVARVDDSADGGLDGESHRVGDGVVDVDELHREAAEAEHGARLLREDLGVFQQTVLLELELDQSGRERRRVKRHVQLAQDIGDASDMVFVPVREDDAAHTGGVVFQIGDVGQNDINAVHVFIREAHAAIHHDDVVAVLKCRHVFADLTETAERDDF